MTDPNAKKTEQTNDFEQYLQFVRQDSRYQNIRDLYTETEALIPLEAETVERQSERPEQGIEQAQKKVERFPVLEGLRQYALGREQQHVLLAGRPGSGKSTTLKRLLLELADAGLSEFAVIPVYVQLKSDRAITDLIRTEFRKAKVRVTPEQLDDWLLQDQLLLLLDGVNEIPSEERRRQLQDFREDNHTTPMILTTRDLSVGGDLGIAKRLEMRPLNEPQMREFVSKYLTKRGMPDQADTLLRQLRDRLREIAETPLLLKMLCDVFDPATQQIPKNKGELFRQFDRDYERIKKDTEYVPVSENFWEFKTDILQFLAFSMIQTDDPKSVEACYTVPSDWAERLLEKWLNSRGISDPATKAKLWLKDLRRCHLLQDAKDLGDIEFHHQLFQEYYTAEYLRQLLPELSNEQLKRDYLNLLKWTEPIALMLALMDEKEQALRVAELALDVDLKLGARLAGEVTSDFQPATVEKVIALPVADWLKVELLGQTQSEFTASELLFFLAHQNIFIAKTAAACIGETHNQAAIDILIKRLEEISIQFFSQKSWGWPDKMGDLWTIHIQALSHLSPQTSIQFLRDKLEEHGTLLLTTTKAAEVLMQLDAERIIPELLEEFITAQQEEREKIAAARKESKKEIQAPLVKDSWISEVSKPVILTPPSLEFRKRNYILNLLGVSTDYKLLIPALIQAFEQEPDETIQEQIIKILGESKHETAIHLLVQILEKGSNKLRSEAAKQLIKIKSLDDSEDLEKLRDLAEYEDWNISWCAAIILGHLKNPTVAPRMMYELENHQTPGIRATAARVLGFISDSSCVPSLIKTINSDSNRYVRINAACSLSYFDRKETIPILLDLLKKPTNADPHAEIMESLARFDLKKPLLEIIKSKRLHWQRAAVELGKLAKSQGYGESEVLPYLFEALENPGHESSSETIALLSELPDLETLNCLIDALEFPEKYTEDTYFPNRVALVLVRYPPKRIAGKLADLTALYSNNYIQQLSWLIPTIQYRCKFYNYEIWQELIQNEKSEIQNEDWAVASQTTYVFPNATNPKIIERVDHYHENSPSTKEPPS